EVLPYHSNIRAIAEDVFDVVDADYPARAKDQGDHAIIGASNYGQGSSREHAAIAPRYLGLRVVLAESVSRIHWQNLASVVLVPLVFDDADDHARLQQGSELKLQGVHDALANGDTLSVQVDGDKITCRHALSPRQVEVLRAGGLINWKRDQG